MGVQTTQGYRGKLVDALTGTILDQFADENIKVSNNILDLFDLGEIPGTYTQQITLPGTKKNNAFFEQYYDISVWEPDIFNTNQVVEAYLDFDSFYLVNGYLQLNKVNVLENKFVDSYEVTLFGIISNFSIDTKSSFLTDLSSLSAYNHTASYDNISASWQRNLFNGDIVYPMAEYGQKVYYSQIDFDGIDDNQNALVVQDYKPAIRIKKVWDAIFNQFGYTYTGSFWNESWLNDVYLNCNNSLQTPVFNPSIEGFGTGRVTNVSGSTPINLTATVSSSFIFNSVSSNVDNKFAIDGVYTKYTVDQKTTLDMTLDLAFKVTHTGASGSGMPAWYITWVKDSDGTVQDTQTLAGPINTYITTIRDSRVTTVTETFNLKGVPVISATLPTGTYRIYIFYYVYGTNNFTVQLNPDASNLCALSINRVRQAGDQQVMDIPSNMPFGTAGIKVIDFIRSIQKKFNLIIYPDKQNPNQFIVETFNNWYKQGQIKDFNRYINLADKITYTPANQLGYKKVLFTDADDTDYIETLFKRTNNRIYGQSTFYDSGSYYSQGSLDVISDVIASGPLGQVPGSVYTGSIATTNTNCSTYQINYGGEGPLGSAAAYYTSCAGSPATQSMGGSTVNAWICAKTGTVSLAGSQISWTLQGSCSVPPTGSAASGSGNPMWIPYYIADAQYTPARVLPRLMFYNGLINVSPYWIQGYYDSTKAIVSSYRQTQYPYFDNYSTGSINGTSSIYPQLNSRSLLYNNEQAVWGTTPTSSLVSEYWDTYLALLYNPRTRLVDATAVIPLADYFDLELNDIAEFRGNYYHLRAINDYNLTTGETNIQMLGPIIPDTISSILSGSWIPYTDACAFNYTASLINDFAAPTWSLGYNVSNSELACTSSTSIYYSPIGTTLIPGTTLYYNSSSLGLTNPVSGGLYSNGSKYYNITGSGEILSTGSCPCFNSGDGFLAYNYTYPLPHVYTLINNTTNGNIFAGSDNTPSDLNYYSGSTINDFVAITKTGSINMNFNTGSFNTGSGFNGSVNTISQFSDGKLFVGGGFTTYRSTVSQSKIVKLDTTGGIDNTFNRGQFAGTIFSPVGSVWGSAIQSDNKVVVVGKFTYYSGSWVNGIVRINSDGTYDPTFNSGVSASGGISEGGQDDIAVKITPDNKILVYGSQFQTYSGSAVNGFVKINLSGSIDTTFNTGSGFYYTNTDGQRLMDVIFQPDGKMIVGGWFNAYSGSSVNQMVRINTNGTIDTTFNARTFTGTSGPRALGLQSNGKIVVYAGKTSNNVDQTYDGVTVNSLFRLNSDGTLDDTFVGSVNSIDGAEQPIPPGWLNSWGVMTVLPNDQIILCVQNMRDYAGVEVHQIAKLNSNGSLSTC